MSTSEWREVGAKLEAIGLKLKLHYQQERQPAPQDSDAFERLAQAIDDAFDALGTAADDEAVKADVRDAGKALSNALATTFAEASRSMKRALSSPPERVEIETEPDPPPTP